MKSKITQWDEKVIEELMDSVPSGSVIAKSDDHIVVGNFGSFEFDSLQDTINYGDEPLTRWTTAYQDYVLKFQLLKDEQGHVSKVYALPSEAEKLYRIAEPDGKEWHLVSDKKAARYERLAEHSRL